ncbi:hypothetical protein E2C01_028913 [Portunus trituberculatus]|uniref:Uncharacterized protein n=1 Tax=Portunus trituberculatus TaxID=210409 RepID=A0A5B7EQT1_PORTR|nr:hypothetical protein [Portunus trituberculatus]
MAMHESLSENVWITLTGAAALPAFPRPLHQSQTYAAGKSAGLDRTLAHQEREARTVLVSIEQ